MKKRIYLIYLLLLVCNSIFAYHRVFNPMTLKPDFTVDNLVGWYDHEISINPHSTNAGFSVQVDFSTPATPLNRKILTIGGNWQTSMDFGLSVIENNSGLKFRRHVKCKGSTGFYDDDSWNSNILKRNTNYSLKVEIDETRLRYSIWEEGKPETILYEYEFYGMASSYLKDILVRTTNNLAYAVDPHYFPQKLIVEDLGTGVGVTPIEPKPNVRWGHLINLNSQKYMRRKGSTSLGDLIYQRSLSGSANDIWEMHPNFDSKRTPLSYTTTFNNLYSDYYLTIQDCKPGDNIPLYEVSLSDCKNWKVMKQVKEAIYFNLYNDNTDSYISVRDKSKEENAQIVTSKKITGAECAWNFEDLNLKGPIETGYYSIQNKNSSKYLYVRNHSTSAGEYIIQHSDNGTNQNLWYIEKQPGGFYIMSNMDSGLYMEVENGSFDNAAYIKQVKLPRFGYKKWIIQKSSESDTYTIQNLASGKYMVIQNASTAEDAYAIQYNTGEENKLWKLNKVNFTPLPSTWSGLGGVYKIKNLYTGMYLVVKDASTAASEHLVAWDSANSKNAWWSVIQKKNGAWLIKNLNSQLYMNVDGNSMEEGASIVQWGDIGGDTGNSLWNIIKAPVPLPNIFFLKNVRSGKYAHIQNDSETPGAWITQQNGDTPYGIDNRMRWEFIRVTSPTNTTLTKSNTTDSEEKTAISPSLLKIMNISDNIFEISSSDKEMSQIKLISITGQLLNQYNVGTTQYRINLDKFISGVYILNIIYKDGNNESRKILIK